MEKLFSEKLQNFEQETTTDFDQAVERKIDRLHWPKFIKWIIGALLIAGMAVVIPFAMNSSDSQETQTTEMNKPSSLSSSQKELEEGIAKTKLDVVIEPALTEQGRSIEMPASEFELGNSTDKNTITETKSIIDSASLSETNDLEDNSEFKNTLAYTSNPINLHKKTGNKASKEKHILRQEDLTIINENDGHSNQVNSPVFMESQIVIQALSLNSPSVELSKKQKLSPTSLLDKEYLAKENTKARKEREKELRYREQQLEKKNRKVEKQLAKEKRVSEKLALKAERKEQQIEKQQKRKQPKIRKQKVPGIYEGAIEFSAAPIFVRNLSPALEPENDTVTNWLTNKDFKPSYDFGVEFMFKQKESNWLLKTGLHYQQLSEEVNYYFLREYMDEGLSHWNYDSIFEYHIDPPNFDTVLVGIDSSWYEHWERSETTQKYTNHYQYLNISILLGYQIDMRKPTSDPDFKKGFDIHVLMGTGLGILLKSEGYHYDTDGYIYSYPDSQKTTIDWYVNTQVAINYHWKNISLFAKPKLQFQMRKRPFDGYFENRHYLIYGVDFGVRINIFFHRAPKRDKLTTKHI